MRKQHAYTEDELLQSLQSGAGDGFAIIFKEWYRPLCYFALRYTNDKDAVQDIVEDSFIKVWERRETFNNLRALKSWLYSTVRNACLNWLCHQRCERRYAKEQCHQHEPAEPSLFDGVLRAEFMQLVMASLNRLPPQCRKIYEMLYIEGKSPKEAAQELKLSMSTIKYHKAYGLALLRKMLAGMMGLLILFFCVF